jgi:hypothetical protein
LPQKKSEEEEEEKEKTDETREERRIRWTPLSSLSLFLDRKRSRRPTQWEEKNKKSCAKQF